MPKGMGYGKGEREYAANEFDKKRKTGKQARRIKKAAKMGMKSTGRKPLGAGSIADDVAYEMHCKKVMKKASMPKTRGKQASMDEGDGMKPMGLQGAV